MTHIIETMLAGGMAKWSVSMLRLTIWWPESSSDHQLNLFPASLRMKSLVMLKIATWLPPTSCFVLFCFFNSVMFYLDYMLKNYLNGVPVIYLAGVPKFNSTQFHFFFHFPLFEGNIL